MKAPFNAILDGLTYDDLAGKRQPRLYVILAGLLILLLAGLASCAIQERQALLDEVRATPQPVALSPEPTVTPALTPTLPPACPTDPAGWQFLETLPGSNFQRIEPGCVYSGLGHTVAWALAIRSGYTRAEAAQALGLAAIPLHQGRSVRTLTDTLGPLDLEVTFTPPHPDFAEWRLDPNGQPTLSYAVRGCFRTTKIVGNRAEPWNPDFPVLCVLSEDSAGSQIVIKLGATIFTGPAQPMRSFALFGYTGNGEWVWLGNQTAPQVGLASIPNFEAEAQASAARQGLPVWDAAWLAKNYRLNNQPLPPDWQNQVDPTNQQVILNGLNAVLEPAQP